MLEVAMPAKNGLNHLLEGLNINTVSLTFVAKYIYICICCISINFEHPINLVNYFLISMEKLKRILLAILANY